MKNPNYLFCKKGTETCFISGVITKVVDRPNSHYCSVDIDCGQTEDINVMCFDNIASGGIGVNHRNLALKAEAILAEGKKAFIAVCVQKEIYEGKVTYKSISTSIVPLDGVCKKTFITIPLNQDIEWGEKSAQNTCIMTGFVTGVFENEKDYKISFKNDEGFVSTKCFFISDENNPFGDAAEIKRLKDNREKVHAVIPTIKVTKTFDGRNFSYYRALCVSYAIRE